MICTKLKNTPAERLCRCVNPHVVCILVGVCGFLLNELGKDFWSGRKAEVTKSLPSFVPCGTLFS